MTPESKTHKINSIIDLNRKLKKKHKELHRLQNRYMKDVIEFIKEEMDIKKVHRKAIQDSDRTIWVELFPGLDIELCRIDSDISFMDTLLGLKIFFFLSGDERRRFFLVFVESLKRYCKEMKE